MIKFKHFMESVDEMSSKAGKNLHLEHLEDLVFLGGITGLRDSITFLQNLRDMLAGHSNEKGTSITTKWDGAPAIFCGINPDNGKFFVATKGAFANNPKLCYTDKDVDLYYPNSGLNKKLKLALEYLPDLGITNVLQGDMMFTDGDVASEFIDGERYATFRPNTITYAVPYSSDLAKRILASKIGVVFHTTYRGRPFANMKASFGADIGALKPSRAVWYRDASFVDATGAATFTAAETAKLNGILKEIGVLFRQLNSPIVNKIATVEAYSQQIMTYNNSKVRQGQEITNIVAHIGGLHKDLYDKMTKFALEAKKPETRANRARERDEVLKFWKDRAVIKNLQTSLQIYNLIIEAKLMIIRKLEQVSDIGTFIRTDDGYKVTKAEGFVCIDHLGTSAIKLVDRLSFSFHNFNVAKDWIGKK